MWTKGYVNDDNIQMLIFLILFLFSINQTNGISENTTTNDNSLPIEKLLNQQYDNRQIKSYQTINDRPWRKSNSIESLKKLMATHRQRLATVNRTTTPAVTTSMLKNFTLYTNKSIESFESSGNRFYIKIGYR